MLLHAAIVPPMPVLEAAASALRFAEEQAAGGRSAPGPPLEFVPARQMHVPFVRFGSITSGDASALAETLLARAADWARPTVHLRGAQLAEATSGRTLCMSLEGDVVELITIARGVTQCVPRLGLRFHRNNFAPQLSVARVTRPTPARVMSLLNVLETFQSVSWTVSHVLLLKRSFDGTSSGVTEYQRIPLGPH
jgi:2'-5' RNA ligase